MIRMIRPAVRPLDTRTVRMPAKTADAELLTPEHKAFRLAVMERAGWQCEWVEAGRRCAVRAPTRLFADHRVERRDGGAAFDPANGQCLCGSHHTLKTARTRAGRLAAKS